MNGGAAVHHLFLQTVYSVRQLCILQPELVARPELVLQNQVVDELRLVLVYKNFLLDLRVLQIVLRAEHVVEHLLADRELPQQHLTDQKIDLILIQARYVPLLSHELLEHLLLLLYELRVGIHNRLFNPLVQLLVFLLRRLLVLNDVSHVLRGQLLHALEHRDVLDAHVGAAILLNIIQLIVVAPVLLLQGVAAQLVLRQLSEQLRPVMQYEVPVQLLTDFLKLRVL